MNVQEQKNRMANLELLRCLAMMMVVVLHYLGKGKLLEDPANPQMGLVGVTAWLLESFCIVAVNLYMMISGFFLCTSSLKWSRLLRLWIQVWSYSVCVGGMALFLGVVPQEQQGVHYLLQLLFPIGMGHYWFLTAYVYLYLLLPFLSIAVQKMHKEQLRFVIGLLFFVFCIEKSILPVRLEMDQMGYDCLWYLCMFLLAAFIRKYGIPVLQKGKIALYLYLVSAFGIFLEIMLLHVVYVRTGRFQLLLTVSTEYNHILTTLAAVGLFLFFLQRRVTGSVAKWVSKIGPYTLGVYLLHENIGVRTLWQQWFAADRIRSVPGLLFFTVLAAGAVFAAGIVIEWIRVSFLKKLHLCGLQNGWYQSIYEKICRMDTLMQELSVQKEEGR